MVMNFCVPTAALESKRVYLKDYKKPNFTINSVNLTIEIGPKETIVTNQMQISRIGRFTKVPLVLDGLDQEFVSATLNGKELTNKQYTLTQKSLSIPGVADSFSLTVVSKIYPQNNTALEGLYQAGDTFLTQCEAQGFRKITYYLDRPDVMSVFTTKIIADKKYPVLLSNGDLIDAGELPNNKHYCTWSDKSKKPSYLFAAVIGDFKVKKDTFTTKSGKTVALEIYVPEVDLSKTETAMDALKVAMKWDEEVFDREYDLNTYMIVGTPKFNSGAMENKGLNIFNNELLLVNKDIATDSDYQSVYSVVGHEYFHNWTGNRVTLRDWFQLSLKEGLTVFREQEFISDLFSRPIKRIEDANFIKAVQFKEDAGKLAHSVRPDSYISIRNFYTATVYEKGAEVIRMIQTILGKEGFKKGMDLYFKRYDGQAVTCDDFVKAMEDATGVDLTQFKLWYSQAGTPVLDVASHYDSAKQVYTLEIKQSCPPTPGQSKKHPFYIPIKLGLVFPKTVETTEQLIHMKKASETFKFYDVKEEPIPSLLRDFSAPVKIYYPYTNKQLLTLFEYDDNAFNCWESGQKYMEKLIINLSEDIKSTVNEEFYRAIKQVLRNEKLDQEFIARSITLPRELIIHQQVKVIDPEAIHQARNHLRKLLGTRLKDDFLQIYNGLKHALGEHTYSPSKKDSAKRSLKNICLSYIYMGNEKLGIKLAKEQLEKADNLTDRVAALAIIFNSNDDVLYKNTADSFYKQWENETLVVHKWLTLQAISERTDTLLKVQELTKHPAFDFSVPNCIYALIGSFTANYSKFHALDGSGYKFLKDIILRLDKSNSDLAASLAKVFANWKQFEPIRRGMMQHTLEEMKTVGLSEATGEIVHTILA